MCNGALFASLLSFTAMDTSFIYQNGDENISKSGVTHITHI